MRQRGTVFLQHLQGQLVTRTIGPGRFGHARFVQARRILGPFFWQIQPGVDQGVPLAGDIAQGDGYLAVIDFAQTATPLTGYAHRLPTGLGKPRRIEHQHPIALSQVRLDLAPQLLAQGGIVPRVPPNEALQREARLAQTIGDRFDVFAFHVRQQATHIGFGMLIGSLPLEDTRQRAS